jgi:anti-sigma regulatory factor (Ser/Thr protein kinase)
MMPSKQATASFRAVQIDLPRRPDCAITARRFIEDRLGTELGEGALERAMLTTSELVTNAWKHGQGTIQLRVVHSSDRLRIEVVDEGSDTVPAIRPQKEDDEGGWGLRIVDQLAVSWGWTKDTTRVWAELPLD